MAMSLTSWATGSSIGPDSEVGGCRSASRTSRKGERSVGGGIVEAPDFLSAITKSHVRGCNPCGGVAVLELPGRGRREDPSGNGSRGGAEHARDPRAGRPRGTDVRLHRRRRLMQPTDDDIRAEIERVLMALRAELERA